DWAARNPSAPHFPPGLQLLQPKREPEDHDAWLCDQRTPQTSLAPEFPPIAPSALPPRAESPSPPRPFPSHLRRTVADLDDPSFSSPAAPAPRAEDEDAMVLDGPGEHAQAFPEHPGLEDAQDLLAPGSDDEDDLHTGLEDDGVSPVSDAARQWAAMVAPEFRFTTVPLDAVPVCREPTDGMRRDQRWQHVDASDKAHWDRYARMNPCFGIYVCSVDGNTNIGALDGVPLTIDLQRLELAPARAAQGGPPVRPGLFLAHNITARTCENYTDRPFYKVGRYCFGTFKYDEGDSYWLGTYSNTLMPKDDFAKGIRFACRGSQAVKHPFLNIEAKYPGQGQAAWSAFLKSIEPRELVLIPKNFNGVLTTKYNVYSTPVVYHANGIAKTLDDTQFADLFAAMGSLRIPQPLRGAATTRQAYHCVICLGLSHPTGKCPAKGIPGWDAPQQPPRPRPSSSTNGLPNGLPRPGPPSGGNPCRGRV
ncbi:hypothetical protein AURDEDRAFT_165070, partial [Auricularia subglabra TFB-10046 SS5]